MSPKTDAAHRQIEQTVLSSLTHLVPSHRADRADRPVQAGQKAD